MGQEVSASCPQPALQHGACHVFVGLSGTAVKDRHNTCPSANWMSLRSHRCSLPSKGRSCSEPPARQDVVQTLLQEDLYRATVRATPSSLTGCPSRARINPAPSIHALKPSRHPHFVSVPAWPSALQHAHNIRCDQSLNRASIVSSILQPHPQLPLLLQHLQLKPLHAILELSLIHI